MFELEYIGDGSGQIGIPARNLTGEDLTRLKRQLGVDRSYLLASGLYKEVTPKKAKGKGKEDKILKPSPENKGA